MDTRAESSSMEWMNEWMDELKSSMNKYSSCSLLENSSFERKLTVNYLPKRKIF